MVSVVSWSVFILRITLLSKLILINIGTEYRSVQTKEIHHITLETALIWTVEKKLKKYVYGGSISSDGFDYGTDYDALK